MDPALDYSRHGISPVVNVEEQIQVFHLKFGKILRIESFYQYARIKDNISWLQLGFYGKASYEYFSL
jgi:hypothetical protein